MTDRLGPIPFEQLGEAQRRVAERVIAGPRGALYGPFVPLIRSPELIISGLSIHDHQEQCAVPA